MKTLELLKISEAKIRDSVSRLIGLDDLINMGSEELELVKNLDRYAITLSKLLNELAEENKKLKEEIEALKLNS